MNKLKIVLFVSLIVLSLSVTAKEVVNCAFKQIGAKFPAHHGEILIVNNLLIIVITNLFQILLKHKQVEIK